MNNMPDKPYTKLLEKLNNWRKEPPDPIPDPIDGDDDPLNLRAIDVAIVLLTKMLTLENVEPTDNGGLYITGDQLEITLTPEGRIEYIRFVNNNKDGLYSDEMVPRGPLNVEYLYAT